MRTGVWLHGDSLSKQDPARKRYPEGPSVFVFDRPFLDRARLSFKRIFFLYECAIKAADEMRVEAGRTNPLGRFGLGGAGAVGEVSGDRVAFAEVAGDGGAVEAKGGGGGGEGRGDGDGTGGVSGKAVHTVLERSGERVELGERWPSFLPRLRDYGGLEGFKGGDAFIF